MTTIPSRHSVLDLARDFFGASASTATRRQPQVGANIGRAGLDRHHASGTTAAVAGPPAARGRAWPAAGWVWRLRARDEESMHDDMLRVGREPDRLRTSLVALINGGRPHR